MKPIRFICTVPRRAECGGWCGLERNAKDQYLILYVPIEEIVFDEILFQCAVYAIAVPIVPGTSVSVLSPFCTHQKFETLRFQFINFNFCLWSDLRCSNCRRIYFNASVYLLVPANWLSTFTKFYIFDFNAAQSRMEGLNSIDSPHFTSFDSWIRNCWSRLESPHSEAKCGPIPWEHSPRCVSGSGCCERHSSVRLQLHFVQLYWKVCVFRSVREDRNVYFKCAWIYHSLTPLT